MVDPTLLFPQLILLYIQDNCYLHMIIRHKTVIVSLIKTITVLCDVTVHKIPPGHFFTRNGELSNPFFLWCARVLMSWCVPSIIKAVTVLCNVTVHKIPPGHFFTRNGELSNRFFLWCARVLMSWCVPSVIKAITVLCDVTVHKIPPGVESLCPHRKQA